MKFPLKLWKIVNECTSGAIGWGMDGDRIFVDCDKFELEFLSNEAGGFKAKNIDSFIRQLNLYGFRKCSRYSDVHEFRNRYFLRGRKDLLKFLSRKMKYTKISMVSESPEKKYSLEEKLDNNNEMQNVKNDFNTALESQSSNYNILMNQYQHYYALYSDWLRTKTKKPDVESLENLERNMNSQQSTESTVSMANYGMYGNIVFVPIPVPYSWHSGLSNGSFPLLMNMPFQSGDVKMPFQSGDVKMPFQVEM